LPLSGVKSASLTPSDQWKNVSRIFESKFEGDEAIAPDTPNWFCQETWGREGILKSKEKGKEADAEHMQEVKRKIGKRSKESGKM
jgi:hypothetical protein